MRSGTLFIVLAVVLCLAAPSLAAQQSTGAWVLRKTEPWENRNGPDIPGTLRYTISSTVGGSRQTRDYFPEKSHQEFKCSWNTPPSILVPGQELPYQLSVSASATEGLKGRQPFARGYMYLQLNQWDKDGRYVTGGNLFDTFCEATGGASATKTCSGKWTVPGGSVDRWLHVSGACSGAAGSSGYWSIFEYVPDHVPGPSPTSSPPPSPSPTGDIGQTPSSCTLALNRPARQSSTAYGGAAPRAVDGNTSGVFSAGSVTHTDKQSEAWWEVDLGLLSQINFVYLWNRTDCCAERLSNFYLLVSKNPFPEGNLKQLLKNRDIWRFKHNGQLPKKQRLDVNFQGRYVRIQLIGTNFLSLAEVQVCGSAFTSTTPQKESEGIKKPSEQKVISGIVGPKGHCKPDWGYFTVPSGQKASGFRYGGLESGFNCETGAKIRRKGFTIHKNDPMWTRVYSYSVNEKGQSFETGGPLNVLVITPGSYFISVDGGYDAKVKVFFKLR